jgi:hypothetical protein
MKPKKKSIVVYDRQKKYDCTSIFRSFLIGVLDLLPAEAQAEYSDLLQVYDRSIARMLRKGRHITRKPFKIIAIDDIDEQILRGARKAMNEAQSSIFDYYTSAQLLWTIVNPILHICRVGSSEKELKKFPPQDASALRLLWDFFSLELQKKSGQDAIRQPLIDISRSMSMYLLEQCSFEDGIYSIDSIVEDDDHLYWTPVAGIRKSKQERMFTIDKKARKAFKLGIVERGKLRWVEIKRMPVFVQQHALDRLRERTSPTNNTSGDLFLTMCESFINEPEIIEKDRSFLVPCIYSSEKVGYFQCMITDGAVLITTFLFLTMDGTPEGEQLWKKLRIGRYDKEYLGLDSLKLFMTSDLRSDPEFMTLLRECKCDHLLTLKDTPNRTLTTGIATTVMDYLSSNWRVSKVLENSEFSLI